MKRHLALLISALVATFEVGDVRAGWRSVREQPKRLSSSETPHSPATRLPRSARDNEMGQGDARRSAIAAQDLGRSLNDQGRLTASRESFLRALQFAQASGDGVLESDIRSDLGTSESLLADRPAAFELAHAQCEQANSLAQKFRAERQLAKSLDCLGDVAYYRQRTSEALASYHAAASLWTRIPDPLMRAHNLLLQGDAYSDLGRFDSARQCYARALAVWKTSPNRREEAIALVSTARVHARLGEYQQAIDAFETALQQLAPVGDALWEAAALAGLAEINQGLGDQPTAITQWERALRLLEDAGLKNVAVDALISVGESYLGGGDDAKALERFHRALAMAEEIGIDRWKAFALRDIGAVHLARRSVADAQDYFARSLVVQRALNGAGGEKLEARTRADMGDALNLAGQPRKAIAYFRDALHMSRRASDRVTQARSLAGIAQAQLGEGRPFEARAAISRAIETAESLRAHVGSGDLRASWVASVYRWYELHIEILMELGRRTKDRRFEAAAFELCERARARSLLESLTVHQAGTAWMAPSEPFVALKALQQQILGPDTVLLEYSLGDERSYVWAVTNERYQSYELPPRAAIDASALVLYQRLTARVTGGPTSVVPRDDEEVVEREARRLSAMVLAPVALQLAGRRRVVIVSDGALQYVPFAALPSPNQIGADVPMIVEHEVVMLPSAGVVAARRARSLTALAGEQSVAVLADPVFESKDPRVRGDSGGPSITLLASASLPAHDASVALRSAGFLRDGVLRVPRLIATRKEAEAIAAMARPAKVLTALDFRANRTIAMSAELGQYDIIHFATHGVLNNDAPELSGVILSMFDEHGRPQDGFLRLRDIYGLKLPAQLVVLSACNTAIGKPIRGEGLDGMVRGFLHAGARRVVASYWKVDDAATAVLMQRFYSELLQKKQSPAAAMREAQRAMLSTNRWRAPFYWAGFAVHGDWQ